MELARKQVKDGGVSSGATRRVWVLVPTPRRCPPFPRRVVHMHGRNGRWEGTGKKKKGTATHRRMVSGLATAMAASNLPDSALTIDDIAGAHGIRDWASLVVEWWWGGGGVGGEGRDKLTELLTHSTYCITIRQPTRGEGQRASTVQIDPPSPFTCSTGLPQGCQATVTAVIKIGRLHNPLTQWSLNFY